jgi:D-3-phosphoglycerate dehydrogenase / 2-oxoglutarate reductase
VTGTVTGSVTGTVVVTSRSFSSGRIDLVARLEDAGLTVVRGSTTHDLAAMGTALGDAVAWIAGTAPVTAAHLAAAPHLRLVARYGVGVDAVDVVAAARAGVIVTNTPGANSEAVAEHAVALLFAVLRGVPAGDRRVRRDDWSVSRGRQLAGSVAGVVGFGRIGRGVVGRLRALGCDVLVHDPFLAPDDVLSAGATPATMREVCGSAQVVSLHAPGGATLVDSGWLARCPADQVVVNTARADLVDEPAVAAALRDDRLAGYAADTLAAEAGADTASPLLADDLADRVVVTPHLGAQTREAVDTMGSLAVHDVLAVLAGRPPAHPVTAPGAHL